MIGRLKTDSFAGPIVALSIVLAAVLAGGVMVGQAREVSRSEAAIAAIRQDLATAVESHAKATDEIEGLRTRLERVEASATATAAENESLKAVVASQAVTIKEQERTITKMRAVSPSVAKTTPKARVTATKATSSASSGHLGGAAKWRSLVTRYFPASAVNAALCVIRGESGGSASVVNSHGCVGLFQINADAHGYSVKALQDPTTNVRVAARLYAKSGWSAWSVRPCSRCR